MIQVEVNEGNVRMSMHGSAAQLSAEIGVAVKSLLDQTADNKPFNKAIMCVILCSIESYVNEQEGKSDNE